MLRRNFRRLDISQKTGHRYVDGSRRTLDPAGLPTDLYQPPISNRNYPKRSQAWHPVVAGKPNPFKGNIVVAGGGAIGSCIGSMFGLRGWHVTILERRQRPSLKDKVASIETALLTKRAVDTMGAAGLRVAELKQMGGRKVTGILEHPGNINTWLTRGLCERHPFPVNMLTIDINQLRHTFSSHVESLPADNARIFYNHAVAAVFSERKQVVLKPLRPHERDKTGRNGNNVSWAEWELIKKNREDAEKDASKEISTVVEKWEDNVEAINYDLLICADGANSKMRQLLGLGETFYNTWGVRWFSVTGSDLRADHIHQWFHHFKDEGEDAERVNLGFIQAFPVAEDKRFNVMFHFPIRKLQEMTFDQLREKYAPDLTGDFDIEQPTIKPAPTVYAETLYNSKAFPNAVLLGDAAHCCHPVLNQNLSIAMEDCGILLNSVDSEMYRHNMYASLRVYNRERGTAGDALRAITERNLYFTRRKHWDPVIRMRNEYTHMMHYVAPRSVNEWKSGNSNYAYSRSMSTMLNGRGYTSYDQAEWQQYNMNQWMWATRLYN